MSANALVWWVTLLATAIVLAMAGAQVARALRELTRLKERVAGYAELPLFAAVERAEMSAHRLERVSDQFAPLVARAQTALAIIRRGPIPPELITAAKRVGAEIAALRTFASR